MASASDFPVTIPFSSVVGIEMGMTRSYQPEKVELVVGPEQRASLAEISRASPSMAPTPSSCSP